MAARLSELKPRRLFCASGRKLSHDVLFWLLQTGGWAAFGLMMFGYALARESPLQAIFDVLFLIATGFGLTTLYRHLYHRWRLRGTPPIRLSAYVLALSVLGAPAWYEPQLLLCGIASCAIPSLVRLLPTSALRPLDA